MGWDSRTSNRRKPIGWERTRRRIYHRDDQACVVCGKGLCLADARCDHIIPWWKGGDESDANLQTLCVPCHKSKCSAEQRERVNQGAPGNRAARQVQGNIPHPGTPSPPST